MTASSGHGDPTLRQLTAAAGLMFALCLIPLSLAAGVTVDSWWAGNGAQPPPIAVDWVGRVLTGSNIHLWFQGHPAPVPGPTSTAAVWTVAVIVYLATLSVVAWLLWWTLAPARARPGMATRGQADKTLAATALLHRTWVRADGQLLPRRRGSKAVELRPDLYRSTRLGTGRVNGEH